MAGPQVARRLLTGRTAAGCWWATLALTETTSYGVLSYAFGVFLLPMQHELGWSRTVLAWAHVSQLILFYAIWAGIGITMAAVLYEPAFAVIASSFPAESDRTRALLSLTVMAGFASVIYVPLAGWLVEIHGWPPVAAAALRTVTGSYQLVLAAVALASVIASIAMARAQQLHSQQVTTEG